MLDEVCVKVEEGPGSVDVIEDDCDTLEEELETDDRTEDELVKLEE